VDSANLQAVKEIWAALEREGMDSAIESMLDHCAAEFELRPYFAEGRTLRGHEEVRGFFHEREAAGATLHASPWSFEESGEHVVVSGSIRVQRADGSIADAQLRWTYGFRDGLIRHAGFAPLATVVAR
jgi:ketosteroid isomerase-like protein